MPDRRFQPRRRPSGRRPQAMLLVLLALLLAGSACMLLLPEEPLSQGLDVQGGLSVTLDARKADGSAPSVDEMSAAQAIMERRFDILGAPDASVHILWPDQLLVQVPASVDQVIALSVISSAGQLAFADLSNVDDESLQQAIQYGSFLTREYLEAMGFIKYDDFPANAKLFVPDNSDPDAPVTYSLPFMTYYNPMNYSRLPIGELSYTGPYTPVTVDASSYQPIMTGANIKSANVSIQPNTPFYMVNVSLDDAGTAAFDIATAQLEASRGQIVIILDGFVQSAPAVSNRITDGNVSITGNFDSAAAEGMRAVLLSGEMPVSLNVASTLEVGPVLTQSALIQAAIAAAAGLAVALLLLFFLYRGLGLVAAAAIVAFAALYAGALALLSFFGLFNLTVAALVGMLLSLALASDFTIVTIERLKEEVRMGRSVRASSVSAVGHTSQTAIDAGIAAAVFALALFFIGSGPLKAFGLSFAAGAACAVVALLVLTAPLIRLLAPGAMTKGAGFWGLGEDEAAAQASGETKRGAQDA